MTDLFDPVTLGSATARNRIVFGPHETNLARGRAISDRHIAYYRRRAAGGVGVVITEEASVHRSDWPYERCPLADECVDGWAQVAAVCHDEGALVFAALGHAGGQGSSAYSQLPLLAPSPVPEVNTREVPKAMEHDDIEAVIAGFATAAAAAVDAGCDGVELNAGQHSLLRQFLSGLTNHRSDQWGEDRTLFVVRTLRAVRDALPGAVVGLRLSCDELAPWAGIVPDEAPQLAAALTEFVDYLVVVRGSIYTVSATRPDSHVEPGFNRDVTAAVRAAADGRTAVVGQGSIVDPAMARSWVRDGVADLVEMTRAHIADAAAAAKMSGGDDKRVRPCILCNQWCQVRDPRNPLVSCVADPASGHETDEPALAADPVEAGRRRKVVVAGAGPAGLECARVAAAAGHDVTVFDAAAETGGMLQVAAAGAGRGRLAALVGWLHAECTAGGATVRTATAATAAHLEDADVAVVCTGSVPGAATYDIAPAAVVVSAAQVLGAARRHEPAVALPEGPVVVWDPVGGPVGVSVAETLAAAGRAVTLVTPDLLVGQELARSGDLAPANTRLHQCGVALVRRSVLRTVEPQGCVVEDRFSGERQTLPAAVTVDAGHRLPDEELWAAAGGRPPRAGDAVAPRGVGEAILEGRRVALALAADVGGGGTAASGAGGPPPITPPATLPAQGAHP